MHVKRQKRVEVEMDARRDVARRAVVVSRELLSPIIPAVPELVIVVPLLDAEERTLTTERRVAFEIRLRETVAMAEQLASCESKAECLKQEYSTRTETVAALPIINACTTCRGRCCLNGRENAFLSAEFLAWRLLNEPELTPDTLISQYMEQIPENSIAESCVYHSAHGCVLPASLRSSTCLEFFCAGLQDHSSAIHSSAPLESVCIAADGDHFRRAGYMTADGHRMEITVPDLKD